MSDGFPPELDRLDRVLRAVRFSPRASLGAEIEGRLQRGEGPAPNRMPRPLGRRLGLLVAGLAALLAFVVGGWRYLGIRTQPFVVDRCCYDLDGGGKADDGVHILAGDGERVRRVAIYEDLDGSVSFTRDDLVRYRSP